MAFVRFDRVLVHEFGHDSEDPQTEQDAHVRRQMRVGLEQWNTEQCGKAQDEDELLLAGGNGLVVLVLIYFRLWALDRAFECEGEPDQW